MGWSSATGLFDGVVEQTLSLLDEVNVDTGDPNIISIVVERMYTNVDWDDWDTQSDSKYFDPFLMEVMHDLDELDPNEYAWRKAGCPDDWDWESRGF